VELHRAQPGAPVSVSVLLEGSADGVDARAPGMGHELARDAHRVSPALRAVQAQVSAAAPDWWGGVPDPGDGTLLRVTFWVSALAKVLDAIDAAARETGLRPAVSGSAGAGVLYVTLPAEADPGEVARLARLIHAGAPGRGGVGVLAGPAAVRSAAGAGVVPGLDLMRAVKDQFDPAGRMAPGRVFG
jgi:glycolate oxidase FAD binding subunit